MIAVISDVHANIDALEVVLNRLRGINDIYFLGDIVSYGPYPVESVRRIRSLKKVIMGNHDFVIATDSYGGQRWNTTAENSLKWTQSKVKGDEELVRYIQGLPDHLDEDIFGKRTQFYHGSPISPLFDYVNSDSRTRKAIADTLFSNQNLSAEQLHQVEEALTQYRENLFESIDNICFVGHSHRAGVLTRDGFYSDQEVGGTYKLNGEKVFVNVGAVGLPRDYKGIPCAVLYDGKKVRFLRFKYDALKVSQDVLEKNVCMDKALTKDLASVFA
jgi:predicted phosphodiesterase